MYRIFAAMAGVVAISASAAQAQTNDTIYNFKSADLIRAVSAAGGIAEESDNSRNLTITVKDSIKVDGVVMACRDPDIEDDCLGTSLLATFSPKQGGSSEDVMEAINTYNYRENFGRAYIAPNGNISVRLYIIADGGISRENYKRHIELWSNSLMDFVGYLYDI